MSDRGVMILEALRLGLVGGGGADDWGRGGGVDKERREEESSSPPPPPVITNSRDFVCLRFTYSHIYREKKKASFDHTRHRR